MAFGWGCACSHSEVLAMHESLIFNQLNPLASMFKNSEKKEFLISAADIYASKSILECKIL